MVLSLLVAEAVLLALLIAERWLSLPPFNDLRLARRLPLMERIANTLRVVAPVLIALSFTLVELVEGANARRATIVAAALVWCAFDAVRSVWLPWLQGQPSAPSDAHSVLEPRKPQAVVPTTLQCVQHAQVAACVAMALVVGVAPEG